MLSRRLSNDTVKNRLRGTHLLPAFSQLHYFHIKTYSYLDGSIAAACEERLLCPVDAHGHDGALVGCELVHESALADVKDAQLALLAARNQEVPPGSVHQRLRRRLRVALERCRVGDRPYMCVTSKCQRIIMHLASPRTAACTDRPTRMPTARRAHHATPNRQCIVLQHCLSIGGRYKSEHEFLTRRPRLSLRACPQFQTPTHTHPSTHKHTRARPPQYP